MTYRKVLQFIKKSMVQRALTGQRTDFNALTRKLSRNLLTQADKKSPKSQQKDNRNFRSVDNGNPFFLKCVDDFYFQH